jgi:hypothetical protein
MDDMDGMDYVNPVDKARRIIHRIKSITIHAVHTVRYWNVVRPGRLLRP